MLVCPCWPNSVPPTHEMHNYIINHTRNWTGCTCMWQYFCNPKLNQHNIVDEKTCIRANGAAHFSSVVDLCRQATPLEGHGNTSNQLHRPDRKGMKKMTASAVSTQISICLWRTSMAQSGSGWRKSRTSAQVVHHASTIPAAPWPCCSHVWHFHWNWSRGNTYSNVQKCRVLHAGV